MTRLSKRAAPAEGPVAKFAWELRALQNRMGSDAPSVEEISRREGLPRSTLYAALRGTRLPRREVVAALARAWGADEAEWLDKRSAVESLRSNDPDWQLPDSLARAHQGTVHSLSADMRALLQATGTQIRYVRGETLFEQGQPSSSVLLINHGMAKVFTAGPDGSQVLLAVRGTGGILGERSALVEESHSASAVAATHMMVTRIASTEFRRLVAESSRLGLELARGLAERLKEADARRIDFLLYATDQRLLRVLHALASTYGEPQPDGSVVLPPVFTQNELANLIGASVASCARALARLRDEGFIEVAYRTVRLLRVAE